MGEQSAHRRSCTHTRWEVEEGVRTERTHTTLALALAEAQIGDGKTELAMFTELPCRGYIQLYPSNPRTQTCPAMMLQ